MSALPQNMEALLQFCENGSPNRSVRNRAMDRIAWRVALLGPQRLRPRPQLSPERKTTRIGKGLALILLAEGLQAMARSLAPRLSPSARHANAGPTWRCSRIDPGSEPGEVSGLALVQEQCPGFWMLGLAAGTEGTCTPGFVFNYHGQQSPQISPSGCRREIAFLPLA